MMMVADGEEVTFQCRERLKWDFYKLVVKLGPAEFVRTVFSFNAANGLSGISTPNDNLPDGVIACPELVSMPRTA